MAETENSKDLLSVLWAGADILRGKMDANEYKNYLLGIVFYKYLSDTFLTHVYDLLNDKKPESMTEAQAAYEQAYETEDRDDLLEDIKESYHYTIEPELTYTKLAEAANNNAFQREMLKKAFNNVEQSDPIFANLFADVDLYSTRLGAGEQKQSATISELVKKINEVDLLDYDGDVLGDAYEYLIELEQNQLLSCSCKASMFMMIMLPFGKMVISFFYVIFDHNTVCIKMENKWNPTQN